MNEEAWVATRVADAARDCPAVTESVLTRIAQLLNKRLLEQSLSQADLKNITRELLKEMVPAPPEAKP